MLSAVCLTSVCMTSTWLRPCDCLSYITWSQWRITWVAADPLTQLTAVIYLFRPQCSITVTKWCMISSRMVVESQSSRSRIISTAVVRQWCSWGWFQICRFALQFDIHLFLVKTCHLYTRHACVCLSVLYACFHRLMRYHTARARPWFYIWDKQGP